MRSFATHYPQAEHINASRCRSTEHLHQGSSRALNQGNDDMAKGQQRGNREVRKPKKPEPPKQNASNPSLKGTPPAQQSKKD